MTAPISGCLPVSSWRGRRARTDAVRASISQEWRRVARAAARFAEKQRLSFALLCSHETAEEKEEDSAPKRRPRAGGRRAPRSRDERTTACADSPRTRSDSFRPNACHWETSSVTHRRSSVATRHSRFSQLSTALKRRPLIRADRRTRPRESRTGHGP